MKPVSLRQQELLVEYMARHKDLALGRVRSKEGRALSARLWAELADILNTESVDPSAYRSAKDWNKFYNDYKCRIKNKTRRIAQSQRQTGGGPSDAPPLSELEERLCAIIGPDKFEPLPVQQESVPVSDTYSNVFTSQLHTEAEQQDGLDPEAVVDYELIIQTETVKEQTPQESQYDPSNIDIIQDEQFDPLTMRQRSKQKKPAKEPTENEVEKAKALLADIERARIEVSRSQLECQLARNEIEKQKVEAMNNLAGAAWALVDLFKPDDEIIRRKRARNSSSSDEV